MRRIRIHAAAAEEVAEVAVWYEKERPGLGAEFQQAVEAVLDFLEEEVVPLGAAARRGRRPRPQAPHAPAFPVRSLCLLTSSPKLSGTN